MKPTNEREQIEREIQEQQQKSRERIHCAVNPKRHFD
jgi:hypothetical protein